MLAKVSARGQITIPKPIRQALAIKPGDSVLLIKEGNDLRIRPIHKTMFDLKGTLTLEEPMTFAEMRQKAKEHVARQVMEELNEGKERIR